MGRGGKRETGSYKKRSRTGMQCTERTPPLALEVQRVWKEAGLEERQAWPPRGEVLTSSR